jgi:hypothetical protein
MLTAALGLLVSCSGGGTARATATSVPPAGPAPTAAATSLPAGSVPATTRPGSSRTTIPSPAASATGTGPATVSATAGGLTVTMAVARARARPGAAVDFTVTATDNQGYGFFGYQLTYGDGAFEQNKVPHVCPAAAASGGQQSWHFTHRYQSPGTYNAFIHVEVTCIGDQLTTGAVPLLIS